MTIFENSSAWQYYKSQGGGPALRSHLGYSPQIEEHPEQDRRVLRISIAAAIALHLVLFLIHLPELASEPRRIGTPKRVYILHQARFAPPPPAQQQQIPKKREKRRVIPVPDPTPDEPEPIRLEEVEVPDYVPEDFVGVFGIPDRPPGVGRGGVDAVPVSGNITPPVKLFYPQPQYTEEARRARIQGVVILEATINRQGEVVDIRVLKGLPMGLSESARDTALEWRFKPATENGKPVAVFFNLLVNFSLQ
jgi:TonB family protein